MRLARLRYILSAGLITLMVWTALPSAFANPARRPAKRRAAPPVSAAVRQKAIAQIEQWLAQPAEGTLENPAALVPFYELLHRQQEGEREGPLRILHYGDSHTAADEWTGALRVLFQERFGDGGAGFSYAGRPWAGYRRFDVKSGTTKGWNSDGVVSRKGDGYHGLGGASITTTLAGESVSLEAECEWLEIFYLRQPGGGTLELLDHGEPVAGISTDGDLGPGYYEIQVEPGLHRFELRTLDRAPVRLFGWVAEKERGVTYETLGINGAQASLGLHWNEEIFASNLARRDPAMVVLAYGTNEAGNRDWTPESYRESYTELIRRLREAAPAATILVVGPPDRYVRTRNGWVVMNSIDWVVEAQRLAALANGCAFWDQRTKMGGKGSMRRWVLAGFAQADHVHLTRAGYRRIGEALFRDLMEFYAIFEQVRAESMPARNANGQAREDH